LEGLLGYLLERQKKVKRKEGSRRLITQKNYGRGWGLSGFSKGLDEKEKPASIGRGEGEKLRRRGTKERARNGVVVRG